MKMVTIFIIEQDERLDNFKTDDHINKTKSFLWNDFEDLSFWKAIQRKINSKPITKEECRKQSSQETKDTDLDNKIHDENFKDANCLSQKYEDEVASNLRFLIPVFPESNIEGIPPML